MRKIRAGVMPPQGVRRPDPQALQAFVAYVEDGLDRDAVGASRPGPADAAPAEPRRIHATPSATCWRSTWTWPRCCRPTTRPSASTTSPTCSACRRRCRSATSRRPHASAPSPSAIRRLRAGSDTYRVPQDLSQNQHVEGLPLGTVGGLRVRHTFPLDGEYDFQTKLYRTNLNIVRGLEYPSEFEVAIDGKPVHHVTIGGTDDLAQLFEKPTDTGDAVEARMRVRVKVPAGPHDVTVAFVDHLAGEGHGARAAVPAQLRRQLRVGRPAAHPDAGRHRTVQPDGARRHAEPARDLHAAGPPARRPSAPARRRSSSRLARRAYRQPVGPTETGADPGVLRRGARGTAPSSRGSSAACSASWPARALPSASNATRPARRRAASTP